jgi:uncharacterized phage infection (PIP) family protein YhgE
MLAGKEREDATAIDDGLEAVKELENIKRDLEAIKKATGTDQKANVNDLISHISNFKKLATQYIQNLQKAKEAENKPAATVDNVEETNVYGVEWLLKFFKL